MGQLRSLYGNSSGRFTNHYGLHAYLEYDLSLKYVPTIPIFAVYVPIFMLAQAAVLYLPGLVWKWYEGNMIFQLTSGPNGTLEYTLNTQLNTM